MNQNLPAILTAMLLAGCAGGPAAPPAPVGPTGANGEKCQATAPAIGETTTGTAAHGKYRNLRLPAGWAALHADEAAVTAAIAAQKAGDQAAWACFQTYYPGATRAFDAAGTPPAGG